MKTATVSPFNFEDRVYAWMRRTTLGLKKIQTDVKLLNAEEIVVKHRIYAAITGMIKMQPFQTHFSLYEKNKKDQSKTSAQTRKTEHVP